MISHPKRRQRRAIEAGQASQALLHTSQQRLRSVPPAIARGGHGTRVVEARLVELILTISDSEAFFSFLLLFWAHLSHAAS